jgi:hypothetical protein
LISRVLFQSNSRAVRYVDRFFPDSKIVSFSNPGGGVICYKRAKPLERENAYSGILLLEKMSGIAKSACYINSSSRLDNYLAA